MILPINSNGADDPEADMSDARIHRTIVTEYRRRGPGERANPTEQTMNVTFHALTAVQDAGVDSQPFLTNTFLYGELS